jgi:hypothetical protein
MFRRGENATGKGRFRRGIGLGAVATALCAGVAAVALTGVLGGGSGASTPRADRKASRDQVAKVVKRRAEARREWLRGPAARRERARSRTAYTGLRGTAIARLVARKYPATVDSAKSMVQPRDVRRYLSDYTAIVDSGPGAKAAGGTALAVSSVPLRTGSAGHREAVDLSLRDRGGALEPANALADFSLPANLSDGVGLPSQIRLSIASGDPSGIAPSRLGSSTALYPGVDTDTDVLASATPRGVELFRLVRSPRSPATQVLRLRLPQGASLTETRDGGAQVSQGGKPILAIGAAKAVDAQGVGVPVTMHVRGGALRITISRGKHDWAYPILVDPAIDSYANYDFPGWAGFNYAATGAANNTGNFSLSGDCMYGRSCFGAGLNIYAWQNVFYVAGASGGFTYQAPDIPSVFIADAVLGQVGYYSNDSITPPYMWMGLWDTYYNSENTTRALLNSFWFGTFDLPRAGDSPGVKQLKVELSNIAGGYTHVTRGDHHAYVGTATIYLDDTDVPGFGAISRPPWVDQQAKPFSVTASDAGLGIAGFTLAVPGGPSWYTSVGCAGGNRSPCPTTWSSPANGAVNYDPSVLPQGVDNLTLTATDAAGHVSPNPPTAQIRVDHTAPTLDLSGDLTAAAQDQGGN